jgi:hypothetical protein
MALTHTYSESSTHDLAGISRTRMGGPRLPQTAAAREDLVERFASGAIFGSHMPLDTDAHWDWRNPLNLIPATILLLIVIALVAAIV